jgi:hypothetical protein
LFSRFDTARYALSMRRSNRSRIRHAAQSPSFARHRGSMPCGARDAISWKNVMCRNVTMNVENTWRRPSDPEIAFRRQENPRGRRILQNRSGRVELVTGELRRSGWMTAGNSRPEQTAVSATRPRQVGSTAIGCQSAPPAIAIGVKPRTVCRHQIDTGRFSRLACQPQPQIEKFSRIDRLQRPELCGEEINDPRFQVIHRTGDFDCVARLHFGEYRTIFTNIRDRHFHILPRDRVNKCVIL